MLALLNRWVKPLWRANVLLTKPVCPIRQDCDLLTDKSRLIPTLIDQNPCAHWRRPMDMMRQGWSVSSFQASQQWSTMSS